MRQTSIVTISVGGSTLRTKQGSSSVELGGWVYEPKGVEYSGDVIYTEKLVQSQVTTTLIHCADTDLAGMKTPSGVTLSFTTDTGATYVISGARLQGDPVLSNGEVEVTFFGPPAAETAATRANPYA